MSDRTFTIEDSFFIEGRGLILLYLVSKGTEPVRIHVDDELEIITKDGDLVSTTVTGVETFNAPPSDKWPWGILVSLPKANDLSLQGATAQVVDRPK